MSKCNKKLFINVIYILHGTAHDNDIHDYLQLNYYFNNHKSMDLE